MGGRDIWASARLDKAINEATITRVKTVTIPLPLDTVLLPHDVRPYKSSPKDIPEATKPRDDPDAAMKRFWLLHGHGLH
ncbi:hypothetical protein FRB95_010378 [Tulasnella sp. JGI-2019a]|nr:hypothetical protein FRB95_010378 [Tulasnella sp. JGI-2019a]